jgi:peptidoglycan/LPS O-acetylase OafA/YrhL
MSSRDLRQRAASAGVSASQIEVARDSDDPKSALITLISGGQPPQMKSQSVRAPAVSVDMSGVDVVESTATGVLSQSQNSAQQDVQRKKENPPAPAARPPHAYRPDIDGLRALAVAAVTLYHLNEHWLPGGFVGVDIFFVISGYVVTASLKTRWKKVQKQLEEHEKKSRPGRLSIPSLGWGEGRRAQRDNEVDEEDTTTDPSKLGRSSSFSFDRKSLSVYSDFLLAFYARRVQRLYPALVSTYWFTTLMIALLIPYWSSRRYYWVSAFTSLVGGANIYYTSAAVDYWAQDAVSKAMLNPFLHMWSLGLEEQFYFIFAPLVCLTGGVLSQRFLWGMGVLVLLSFLRCGEQQLAWFSGTEDVSEKSGGEAYSFYMMDCRFWQLGLGCLLVRAEGWAECFLTRKTTPTDSEGGSVGAMIAKRKTAVAKVLSSSLISTPAFAIAIAFATAKASSPEASVPFPLPWAILPTFGAAFYIVAGWSCWRADSLLGGTSPPKATDTTTVLEPQATDAVHQSQTDPAPPPQPEKHVVDPKKAAVVQLPLLNRALAHPKCVLIGQMSYCIYVVHWPVIVGFRWAGLAAPHHSAVFVNCMNFLVAFPLLMLLAALMFYGLETPLRKKRPSRKKVFFLALLSTTLGAAWFVFLDRCAHRFLYEGREICGGQCEREPSSFVVVNDTEINPMGGDVYSRGEDAPLNSRGEDAFAVQTKCGCRWASGRVPPDWNSNLTSSRLVGDAWGGSSTTTSSAVVMNVPTSLLPLCLPTAEEGGEGDGRGADATGTADALPPDWKCGDSRLGSFLHGHDADQLLDDPSRCIAAVKQHFRRRPQHAGQRVFWLFGDSHVTSIAPALRRAIAPTHLFYAQSGVTMLMNSDPCASALLDQLALPGGSGGGLQPGDSVGILYWAERLQSGVSDDSSLFTQRLRRISALLAERNNRTASGGKIDGPGGKLVLFSDWPDLPTSGTLCWPTRTGVRLAECRTPLVDIRRKWASSLSLYKKLESESPATVLYLDVMKPFCSVTAVVAGGGGAGAPKSGGEEEDMGRVCTEEVPGQGTLGYSDSNHLSSAAVYYLSPFLCRWLDGVV